LPKTSVAKGTANKTLASTVGGTAKRTGFSLKLALLCGFFSFLPANHEMSGQVDSKGTPDQGKLAKILEEANAYCRRLEALALDYVCVESVSERVDPYLDSKQLRLPFPRNYPTGVNNYKYDYQLVRKDGEIRENRVLIEENPMKKDEKEAQLKTSVFLLSRVLFGPIAVLSRERQNYYDYRIIEDVELKGDKAFLMEANPRPRFPQRIVSGKVWIRREDYCILKIEWHQRSITNFWVIEDRAKRYKAEPKITFVTEFGFEKNTIRFPSQCFIEEAYRNKKGRKFVRSETTVQYSDYKFFTVETEIRIK
jgi:hypothetical protein